MRNRPAVRVACLALALTITGCARDDPPRPAGQAPSSESSVPAHAPATILAPAEPVKVDEMQATEAAQAQRLSSSRAYLVQAQAAAEQRRGLAVLACDSPGQGDHDACVAAADDGLQEELQAARAEFEAQMRQPN